MNHLILAVWGFTFVLIAVTTSGCKPEASTTPLELKSQTWLPFGSVKPRGWVLTQMQQDLQSGFVGHLDELVPDLILQDDIYGKDRLTKAVRTKDLGVAGADSQWEVQFLWWNSETQSNWWDGFIRHAILTEDPDAMERVKAYVTEKLATQDEDGYIGIYAPDLRYQHTTENGELWAQASLFRGLLAYYEATGDDTVLAAVERAVKQTMEAYPAGASYPFQLEKQFAGAGHGLTFTDVLDRLHQLTGDSSYLDYAVFLYADYDSHEVIEEDIQTAHLLDPAYRFKGHGVHTYEHLRSLTVAAYSNPDPRYQQALEAYLTKLETVLTPSGGPIGDEWVAGREAHPDSVGYEYCSLHELLDSYSVLLQKSGESHWADEMEWLLFNAAQGARHPDESSIAYCKTDNAYHAMGALDLKEVGKDNHTRYKYSPAHQDVAVCCVPNAGRIYPYYIKSMWMKSERGLVANLYGPSILNTQVAGATVSIVQETHYPFEDWIRFQIEADQPAAFDIALRKPKWTHSVRIKSPAAQQEDDQYLYLNHTWQSGDVIEMKWEHTTKEHDDPSGMKYLSHGPLLYALPLPGESQAGKSHPLPGFRDLQYAPEPTREAGFQWVSGSSFTLETDVFDPQQPWKRPTSMQGELYDPESRESIKVALVPIGSTILRKAAFPLKPNL